MLTFISLDVFESNLFQPNAVLFRHYLVRPKVHNNNKFGYLRRK